MTAGAFVEALPCLRRYITSRRVFPAYRTKPGGRDDITQYLTQMILAFGLGLEVCYCRMTDQVWCCKARPERQTFESYAPTGNTEKRLWKRGVLIRGSSTTHAPCACAVHLLVESTLHQGFGLRCLEAEKPPLKSQFQVSG